MLDKKIVIKIFAPPLGKCSYEKSWEYAAEMMALRLNKHFKNLVEIKFIELFTPESFEYAEILNLLKNDESKPPYVMLNDEIIQIGDRLSEKIIKEKIEEFLKNQNTNQGIENA